MLGCFQSFLRFFVQSVVVIVYNAVHTYVTTCFLPEFLIILIVLVECLDVNLIIGHVGIGYTEVSECQLMMRVV